MKKFLDNDLKVLAIPFLILAGIVILMGFSAKIIMDNIGKLNGQVSDAQQMVDSLNFKLNSLQQVKTQALTQSQIALTALPAANSVLGSIIQIKNYLAFFGLTIDQITSGGEEPPTGGVAITELDFSATGTYTSMEQFIQKLRTTLPISTFSNIKIVALSSDSNSYKMTATVNSYSAKLPTTIPSIQEPIVSLTDDEKKVLSEVSTYSIQSPVATVSASVNPTNFVPQGRSDPFTQ